jgi:CMP/dCMP kinase
LKTKTGKSSEVHNSLDADQTMEAKKGNIVICGKLSIHFLKDIATHKIWLDVPLKVRATRSAKRDGISFRKARDNIKKIEEINRKNFKRLYGFDYFAQKNEADFVVNTSDMNIEESVNAILKKIKK